MHPGLVRLTVRSGDREGARNGVRPRGETGPGSFSFSDQVAITSCAESGCGERPGVDATLWLGVAVARRVNLADDGTARDWLNVSYYPDDLDERGTE